MFAHGGHENSDSKTVNSALRLYATAGFAKRAKFIPKVGCEIEWTEFGQAFLKNFATMIDALCISGDEDRLIMLFYLMECWAPDQDSAK